LSDTRGLKECIQEEGRDVIPEDGKENPWSNLEVSKSEHGFNLSEYITIQYFMKFRSEEPVDEGFRGFQASASGGPSRGLG
jgi:hypothetical protein